MDADEPSSPPQVSNMPDWYEIPEALVRNWQAMPDQAKFVPALSRIAWDKLYLAIETLNLANVASLTFAMHSANGEIDKMEAAIEVSKQQTFKIQNALKQFQESVMIAAMESEGKFLDGK